MTSRHRTVIIVPARYASSRFPGKPLHPIRGADGKMRPLVQHSYEAACHVPGVDRVAVATDDTRIADVVRGFGGDVMMTPEHCANGTERVAACLDQLADADLIVNFQGDALLTPPDAVAALIDAMRNDPALPVATVAMPASPETYAHLAADAAAGRVGGTTVVVDRHGRALYFSKRILPYLPEGVLPDPRNPVLLHLGLYGYRRAALGLYLGAEPSWLEQAEGLEQLRFLAHGIAVRVVEVMPPAWDMVEVNNPGDVAIVEAMLRRRDDDVAGTGQGE